MTLDKVKRNGLVLLGCGKMGSALLQGWLAEGVPAASVWVIDPHPSTWLGTQGVRLNQALPKAPAIVVVAVKPQMMAQALPTLRALGGGGTPFLSIAAGITIASYEQMLGAATPLVRAMPNTPAAVARGISAICRNAQATEADMVLAEALLVAVGEVVRLDGEQQMDAVTAVSGSGPAYVFHLIEALAAAAESEGLPAPLAARLALATVAGAGELARRSPESPTQLRINVTSPGGTTAAALAVLMDPATGFVSLLRRAVRAAAARGQELGK